MDNQFRFNKEFGLHLTDRLDGTYYSLLCISVFFFTVLVVILANLNYKTLSQQADQLIYDRYKSMAATFLIEENASLKRSSSLKVRTERIIVESPSRAAALEQEIEKSVARITEKIAQDAEQSATEAAELLPESQEMAGTVGAIESNQLTRSSRWPLGSGVRPRQIGKLEASSIDDLLKNPFNYVITRRGEMYIELTDEITAPPPPPPGYRDPQEIERVVEKNQPMIEHCFRREARHHLGLKGYVKVEFRISYEGYVIPESIRIVNSTLRNRKVEKCIKNYIRRWRNFAQLDEEMGIARVVQKFVFN